MKSFIKSLAIKFILFSSFCLADELKCADNYEYVNSLLDNTKEKSTQVAGTSKLLIDKQPENEQTIQVIEGKELTPQELKQISFLTRHCKKPVLGKEKDN